MAIVIVIHILKHLSTLLLRNFHSQTFKPYQKLYQADTLVAINIKEFECWAHGKKSFAYLLTKQLQKYLSLIIPLRLPPSIEVQS